MSEVHHPEAAGGHPTRRRSGRIPVAAIAVLVILIGGIGWGVYAWSQHRGSDLQKYEARAAHLEAAKWSHDHGEIAVNKETFGPDQQAELDELNRRIAELKADGAR
jgi:uncharacterized protein HemX